MDWAGDVFAEFSQELGLEPELVLIVGLALLVVGLFILVTLVGYLKVLLNIAAFAYPVARVKAIGNRYVSEEGAAELAEIKSAYELAGTIREHGFRLKVEEHTTLREIDNALDRMLVADYLALEESAPGSIRPFFDAFRSLYEIEQVKTAMRCRVAGFQPDEVRARMVPVGTITSEVIEGCAHAESVDEIVLHLQESSYGPALAGALEDYRESGALLPLERALDTAALRQLAGSGTRVERLLAGPVAEFCGALADCYNLNALLRARAAGQSPEEAAAYFVPGGSVLEEWRLKQLMETPTMAETLHQLSGTDYYTAFEPYLAGFENSGSIYPLETELDRLLLGKAGSLALSYHLTGGPLIRFMVARSFEVRNIRAAFHALAEGFPLERAAEFFIAERGGS
jgi:V/A-type H+-transporting ATPase subunit C